MGDQQFSTSRGHVLYVGDFLARYGPDALRYYICAAGPETSDAAFTWADFVTRNNSELVAGWGNLVNRTATMVAKSFGEIPPRAPSSRSTSPCWPPSERASTPSATCSAATGSGPATAEALRVVGEVNKYLTVTEPYKMKDESQRERLATVLHVAAQCVIDCNTLLAPILPHASNKVWTRSVARASSCRCRASSTSRTSTPVTVPGLRLPGDHRRLLRDAAVGEPPVVVGAPVDKPTPVFTKLDPCVVDEELARLPLAEAAPAACAPART